jgi:hypothetical protein
VGKQREESQYVFTVGVTMERQIGIGARVTVLSCNGTGATIDEAVEKAKSVIGAALSRSDKEEG